MADYSILDEAENIATQYAVGKPEYINVPDTDWALVSDETKSLLIQLQQLAKPLGDAYLEAVTQRDQQWKLLLYQRILSRPYLLTIDPEIYDESERIKRETDFIIRAKLWIRDVEELL